MGILCEERVLSKNQVLHVMYFVISFFAFVLRPAPEVPPATDPVAVSSGICSVDKLNTSTISAIIDNATPRPPQRFICWVEDCKKNTSKLKLRFPREADDKGEFISSPIKSNGSVDHCYLLRFSEPMDQLRRVLDILTFLGALLYTTSFALEAKRLGLEMFIQTWKAVPGRVMFGISCLLILTSLPLRYIVSASNRRPIDNCCHVFNSDALFVFLSRI